MRASAIDVYCDLTEAWGDEGPSLRAIQRWFHDVRDDARASLTDPRHSGWPRSTRTPDLNDAMEKLIQKDPLLSCRDIAHPLDACHSTVRRVFDEDHHLRWVCSVWVPRKLIHLEDVHWQMDNSRPHSFRLVQD